MIEKVLFNKFGLFSFQEKIMSWTCPPASSLCILILEEKDINVQTPKQVVSEVDQMIRTWCEKNHIDMKWMLEGSSNGDACGIVYSTNFQNELTFFPKPFLDAFVGKPRPLTHGSTLIVFSTLS